MVKEKLNIWKERFKRLLPQTKHCKICFKEIAITDMCRLFNSDICICQKCQKQLEPKFIRFKIDGYQALAIYDYSEFVKKLIYLYKGCFDYEMKDIFLNLFIKELRLYYKGCYLVPIPSYIKDDEIRGYNHVVEIFKDLGIKTLPIIEKTSHFKQAEKGAKKREEIRKHLALKCQETLKDKRVLIVDDIYTTGSTMKSAINLVEKLNPKEIKILVIAKTKPRKEKKSPINSSLH